MIKKVLNLLYSIYFNFRYLNIKQAIKLPIKINHNINVLKLRKGNIQIDSTKIERFMIELGFDGSGFVAEKKSSLMIENNGTLLFKGKVKLAEGLNIYINNGHVAIGEKIYINRNFLLQCENVIEIGDDSLIGWNVNMRDTSGHKIYKNGKLKETQNKIILGKHVWVASDATIIGNTQIKDGCIVGCNSLVNNLKTKDKNSLIVGSPAIEKEGAYIWEE